MYLLEVLAHQSIYNMASLKILNEDLLNISCKEAMSNPNNIKTLQLSFNICTCNRQRQSKSQCVLHILLQKFSGISYQDLK